MKERMLVGCWLNPRNFTVSATSMDHRSVKLIFDKNRPLETTEILANQDTVFGNLTNRNTVFGRHDWT